MSSDVVHTFSLYYVTPDGILRKHMLASFETQQELDKWVIAQTESNSIFFKYEKVAVADLKGEENE